MRNISYIVKHEEGKYLIDATVTNPASAASVAFAIRVQAVNARTGEQVLPAIMSDNYFSLIKGESKTIAVQFDEKLLGNDKLKLLVRPYNNPVDITN